MDGGGEAGSDSATTFKDFPLSGFHSHISEGGTVAKDTWQRVTDSDDGTLGF